MKRTIVLALLLLLSLAVCAHGQKTRVETQHGTGVPAASRCTAGSEYVDDATGNLYTYKTGVGCILSGNTAAGAGTVTSVSVVSANGLSGTVATATTTPAITLNIAALDAAKIADGTVTSAEFQFINSVTSNVQTQIDSKQASLGFTAENSANKDAASGYAGLTAGSLLKTAEFPAFIGDATSSSGGVALTLATVNGNVGTFGSATTSLTVTANAKGLITAISSQTVTPAVGSITGLGTGVGTWLATPSSANLRAALTDELGTGATLFDGATPTSFVLTNATGLPTTGLTGALQAAQEPAHTGDVTNSGGSLALSIAANAVTLAKLATQATNTVLGNATSGTAVPTALAVGTCSTAGSALIWTTNTGFGCNTSITAAGAPVSGLTGAGTGVLTALAVNVGSAGAFVTFNGAGGTPSSMTATNLSGTAASLTAGAVTGFTAGAGTLTGPASAGTAETLGNNETITGIKTFSPTARSSGSASYFTFNAPADTGITTATESIGVNFVTATRTFVDGTVALQRERFFAGPTYNKTTTSLTITDAFNTYFTPPVAGTGVTFTRGHTLGIVDSTSASSSITGGFVVATTLGTTATSVGIGGGNINAGGTLTVGGATTLSGALNYGGVALSNAVTGTGNMVLSASPTLSGTIGGNLTFSGTTTTFSATSGGVNLSVASANSWWSSDNWIQNGGNATWSGLQTRGASGASYFDLNAYESASAVSTYISTDAASRMALLSGGIYLQSSASGTAGNPVTWITGLQITNTGTINMPNLGASSAATTGTLCWTTGSGLVNVDTTTTCLLSSAKFKMNDRPLIGGLDTILKLRPVSYFLKPEFNPTGLSEQIGLMAEDVFRVDPRLVSLETDGSSPHAVRYQQLTAVLVKAIQEQQYEISELRQTVERGGLPVVPHSLSSGQRHSVHKRPLLKSRFQGGRRHF